MRLPIGFGGLHSMLLEGPSRRATRTASFQAPGRRRGLEVPSHPVPVRGLEARNAGRVSAHREYFNAGSSPPPSLQRLTKVRTGVRPFPAAPVPSSAGPRKCPPREPCSAAGSSGSPVCRPPYLGKRAPGRGPKPVCPWVCCRKLSFSTLVGSPSISVGKAALARGPGPASAPSRPWC